MAAFFDREEVRAEILKGLVVLYPEIGESNIVELFIVNKSGTNCVGHFSCLGKLVEIIDAADQRNDVLAIYTGLNKIKLSSLNSDARLKITNSLDRGKPRAKGEDIERVTGILLDIDPFRGNDDRKDSTTDEEHDVAIEVAQWLKSKLSLMGWPEPLLGDSGNGAQLRYKTDLPGAYESSKQLKRILEAANRIIPGHLKKKVEVDATTYDLSRVSKVFGTITRKGPGTEERPWRRSRIISTPEKLEPVQLDAILKLIEAGKAEDHDEEDFEDSKPPQLGDRNKSLSDAEEDRNIRPCLKEIISKKDIKRLEEVAAHEHKGRVAIATELIVAGYSDEALHEFFSRLDDYDHQKTQYQILNIISFIEKKGGKPWKCEILRKNEVVSADKCKICRWRLGSGLARDIQVNGRYLQDITEDALKALEENNNPPIIFVRSGHLVRLVSKDRIVIEALNEGALRGHLARAAGFVEYKGVDEATGKPKFIKARPPLDVVRDILNLGAWPGFPSIEGITEIPVLRLDGTALIEPGYDDATKLYYAPGTGLQEVILLENPQAEDAKKAANHILDEILIDFPFKDDASRANALALLLSVVVRPMIEGNMPLALLDKPQAGTGASFLAEVVALIATGRPANMMGAPETEDEWRKAITSALLDGSPIIVIDNVVGKLRSSSLTRALTSQTWRDRFLGKSEMVDLPQRAIWIATGNNIVIGGDLARRSYWIRLDASMARPWLRTGFKHEDLLGWIKANQACLLSDLLAMARAWVVAGRPAGSAKSIGGFKEWSDIIGGILEFAGIEGFLANASELYDTMDQDVQQWDEFLGAWAAIHADHPIGAGQLRDELISTEQIYRTLQDAMPDDVAEAVRKDRRASLSLGVVLSKHVDQIYPSGRRLCRENDSHSKSSLWKVAGSGEKQESQSEDHFAGSAGSNLLRGSLHKNQSNLLKCIEVELLPALPANAPTDSDPVFRNYPQNISAYHKSGIEADLSKAAEKQYKDKNITINASESSEFGNIFRYKNGDEISQPDGFSEEEHKKLLRAVDRLLKKKWPLIVKSSYGASLVSESGLPSDRVKAWLGLTGFKCRVLEQSGLEIWDPPEEVQRTGATA